MLGRKKINVRVKGDIIPQQSGSGSGQGGPINPLDFFVNMTVNYMAISVVKPVASWVYISSKHDVEAMVVLSNGSPAQQGQIQFLSNNSSFSPSTGAINTIGRVYSEATFSNTANQTGNVLAKVTGVNVGDGVVNAIGEKSSHLITTYDFYYAFLNPNLLRGHNTYADVIFNPPEAGPFANLNATVSNTVFGHVQPYYNKPLRRFTVTNTIPVEDLAYATNTVMTFLTDAISNLPVIKELNLKKTLQQYSIRFQESGINAVDNFLKVDTSLSERLDNYLKDYSTPGGPDGLHVKFLESHIAAAVTNFNIMINHAAYTIASSVFEDIPYSEYSNKIVSEDWHPVFIPTIVIGTASGNVDLFNPLGFVGDWVMNTWETGFTSFNLSYTGYRAGLTISANGQSASG